MCDLLRLTCDKYNGKDKPAKCATERVRASKIPSKEESVQLLNIQQAVGNLSQPSIYVTYPRRHDATALADEFKASYVVVSEALHTNWYVLSLSFLFASCLKGVLIFMFISCLLTSFTYSFFIKRVTVKLRFSGKA